MIKDELEKALGVSYFVRVSFGFNDKPEDSEKWQFQ